MRNLHLLRTENGPQRMHWNRSLTTALHGHSARGEATLAGMPRAVSSDPGATRQVARQQGAGKA